MAHLIIDDLEEDVELDMEAMRAVSGGSSGGRLLGGGSGQTRMARLEESKLIAGLIKTRDLRSDLLNDR